MNQMYHIKNYIASKVLVNSSNQPIISVEKIIELFLQYLDENKIVYGEGEFHRLAADDKTIIDEKR